MKSGTREDIIRWKMVKNYFIESQTNANSFFCGIWGPGHLI